MIASTLFVGVGSLHGDDQAGWFVADALEERAVVGCDQASASEGWRGAPVTIRKACHPADLMDWLEGTGRLMICDAFLGAGPPGSIYCWRWPDERIRQLRAAGSHDFSLSSVLELADRLGRLPGDVVIWGIEAGRTTPNDGLSPEIVAALPELMRQVWSEISRA